VPDGRSAGPPAFNKMGRHHPRRRMISIHSTFGDYWIARFAGDDTRVKSGFQRGFSPSRTD